MAIGELDSRHQSNADERALEVLNAIPAEQFDGKQRRIDNGQRPQRETIFPRPERISRRRLFRETWEVTKKASFVGLVSAVVLQSCALDNDTKTLADDDQERQRNLMAFELATAGIPESGYSNGARLAQHIELFKYIGFLPPDTDTRHDIYVEYPTFGQLMNTAFDNRNNQYHSYVAMIQRYNQANPGYPLFHSDLQTLFLLTLSLGNTITLKDYDSGKNPIINTILAGVPTGQQERARSLILAHILFDRLSMIASLALDGSQKEQMMLNEINGALRRANIDFSSYEGTQLGTKVDAALDNLLEKAANLPLTKADDMTAYINNRQAVAFSSQQHSLTA